MYSLSPRRPFFPRARNLVITIVVVVVVILYIRKRKRVLKIRDYESSVPHTAAVWSVDREKLRGKVITIYHVHNLNVRVRYVVIYNIITLHLRSMVRDFCRNYITPLIFPLSTGFCFSRHTHIPNIVVQFVF